MEIPGPHWPDSCGHKPHEYVGTIEVWRGKNDDGYDVYDVYAYPSAYGAGHDVCMRFGPEGADYLSVGPIEFLMNNARTETYGPHQQALCLLQDKGKITTTWTRNDPTEESK